MVPKAGILSQWWRGRRIAKNVDFFSHSCPVPKNDTSGAARCAIKDFMDALQHSDSASPFAVGDEKIQAIQMLQEIIKTSLTYPHPINATVPITTLYALPPRAPIPARNQPTPVAVPNPQHTPDHHIIPLGNGQPFSCKCVPEIQIPTSIGPTKIKLDPSYYSGPYFYDWIRSQCPGLPKSLYALETQFLSKSEKVHHLQANAVIKKINGAYQDYHQLLKGTDQETWLQEFSNNLGRLVQVFGTRMPTRPNTTFLCQNLNSKKIIR